MNAAFANCGVIAMSVVRKVAAAINIAVASANFVGFNFEVTSFFML